MAEKNVLSSDKPGYMVLSVRDLNISIVGESDKGPGVARTILRDLSFDIREGQTICLRGASGSGKSLTALAIMRLLPAYARVQGNILFQQGNEITDLLTLSGEAMRKLRGRSIAMIFQEPMTSLNPVHSCGKQVAEVLRQHIPEYRNARKLLRDKVLQLFEEVRIQQPLRAWDAYPHELSGGQKQRVMIAMAMACEPSLLIADEPTTALDASVQKTILDLMMELQQKYGMAMLFITHDEGVAGSLVGSRKSEVGSRKENREILLGDGRLELEGVIGSYGELEDGRRKSEVGRGKSEDGRRKSEGGSRKTEVGRESASVKVSVSKSSEPLLEARGLKLAFVLSHNLWGGVLKRFYALRNVDVVIYPGETLGIVGESGSGKTTLGRSILRLLEADSGSVIFKGKNVSSLKTNEIRRMRKDMQIIFQDPYASLNPRMRIGDAIMEPMRVHGIFGSNHERKEEALRLLTKVGLSEGHFGRFPHEFSGGQRQRICIARALALKPSFLLCDEIVSALDAHIQKQILDLLRHLKDEFGLTYMFISHDLKVIREISDRVVVMKDGEIVEEGDVHTIFGKPAHPYTKQLIEASFLN